MVTTRAAATPPVSLGMTSQEVAEWLKAMSIPDIAISKMLEQEIDGQALASPAITNEFLKNDIGIPIGGTRLKILQLIHEHIAPLADERHVEAPTPPSPSDTTSLSTTDNQVTYSLIADATSKQIIGELKRVQDEVKADPKMRADPGEPAHGHKLGAIITKAASFLNQLTQADEDMFVDFTEPKGETTLPKVPVELTSHQDARLKQLGISSQKIASFIKSYFRATLIGHHATNLMTALEHQPRDCVQSWSIVWEAIYVGMSPVNRYDGQYLSVHVTQGGQAKHQAPADALKSRIQNHRRNLYTLQLVGIEPPSGDELRKFRSVLAYVTALGCRGHELAAVRKTAELVLARHQGERLAGETEAGLSYVRDVDELQNSFERANADPVSGSGARVQPEATRHQSPRPGRNPDHNAVYQPRQGRHHRDRRNSPRDHEYRKPGVSQRVVRFKPNATPTIDKPTNAMNGSPKFGPNQPSPANHRDRKVLTTLEHLDHDTANQVVIDSGASVNVAPSADEKHGEILTLEHPVHLNDGIHTATHLQWQHLSPAGGPPDLTLLIPFLICPGFPAKIISTRYLTKRGYAIHHDETPYIKHPTGSRIPMIVSDEIYLIHAAVHAPPTNFITPYMITDDEDDDEMPELISDSDDSDDDDETLDHDIEPAEQPDAKDRKRPCLSTRRADRSAFPAKMTLMEAHALLGHSRDKKAIAKWCDTHDIAITDHAWEQCVSCDGSNIKDYPHKGTIPKRPGAWSMDFKVNVTDKDTCKFTGALLLVNHVSHYLWTVPTFSRATADIAPTIIQFAKDFNVVSLHCDNAKEFMALQHLPELRHIKFTFTVGGYNPASNGIAERYIGFLSTRYGTLLHAASLNKRVWDDAWLYAAAIFNETPHRDLNYETPASFHEVAHLEHQCPTKYWLAFGTPVWVYNPKDIRQKAANKDDVTRAHLGVYIGGDRAGFHVLTRDGARVSRSITVIRKSWQQISIDHPNDFADVDCFFSFSPNFISAADAELADGANPPAGAEANEAIVRPETGIDEGPNEQPKQRRRRVIPQDELERSVLLTGIKTGNRILPGQTVTFAKSQTLADAAEALEATRKELDGLFEAGCFAAYPIDKYNELSQSMKRAAIVIRVNIKRKKTLEEELKARACADGRDQFLDEVLRSHDRYASTAGLQEVKKLLAIAAQHCMMIASWDAKMAYINALLEGGLVTPVRFQSNLPAKYYPPPGCLWLLLRALYGLPFSGNLWGRKFTKLMTDLGFEILATHESIFKRGTPGVDLILIACYVDDLLVAYTNQADADQLFADLQRDIVLKAQPGDKLEHLGATIKTREDGSFTMAQPKLAAEVMNMLSLSESKPKGAPLPISSSNVTQDDGELLSPHLQSLYRSAVGKIGYLTYTRPDMLFARSMLSRFVKSPSTIHWKLLIHTGKYIAGTLHFGLEFTKGSNLDIHAFSDADHATDKQDRKSMTGSAIFLGNNFIAGESRKQSTVANSSTDAEIRACAMVSRAVVGERSFMEMIGLPQDGPSSIYVDSSSAIRNVQENKNISRQVKHIAIDIATARSFKENGWVVYPKVGTTENIADQMTKALSEAQHVYLRDKYMVNTE